MELREKRTAMIPELPEGEKILVAAGMHWISYILPGLLAASLTAIAARAVITGIPLLQRILGTATESAGKETIAIEAAAAILLLAATALILADRICTSYVVTENRISVRRGWLNVRCDEIAVDRFIAVKTYATWLQRLFATGDIIVFNPDTQLVFHNVPEMEKFKETIMEQQKIIKK